MITNEKSFETYEYDKPLDLEQPKWAVRNNGTSWTPGSFSAITIPAGVYMPKSSWEEPPYLQRVQFSTDSLLDLPDDPSSRILSHIKDFWSKEDAFRDLGVTYKRGILMFGPPGSGKSVTIYRLASILESYNAVMILAKSAGIAKLGVELVKALEPSRKIVVIFEDIDGIIRRESDEELTHLLDGGTDVDNVLFLATTNYPERIPDRVLNRPSRFDVLVKIAMPTADARRAYINHLVKGNLLVDIEELVSKTENMSIASIKELVILTQIFRHSIDVAVSKLTSMDMRETPDIEESSEEDSAVAEQAQEIEI